MSFIEYKFLILMLSSWQYFSFGPGLWTPPLPWIPKFFYIVLKVLKFFSFHLNFIHLEYILINSLRQTFCFPMCLTIVPACFLSCLVFLHWIVMSCLSYSKYSHMCICSCHCILFISLLIYSWNNSIVLLIYLWSISI